MNIQQHILIAEDEPDLRRTMGLVLTAAKFQVTLVTNGQEAIDYLHNNPDVDMLITDIQMPGMNGEELIHHLKKLNPEIPILVITGFGTKELLLRLLRLGCDEYLDKPFTSTVFEKAVQEISNRTNQAKAEKRFHTSDADRGVLLGRELSVLKEQYASLKHQMDTAVDAYHNFSALSTDTHKMKTVLKYQPYAQLGGDWAGASNTDAGVDILVADVSGHDISASFHTVAIRTFFEEHLAQNRDCAYLFELLNRLLIMGPGSERIVTAVFMRFDFLAMQAEMVSAAHLPVTYLPVRENLARPLHVRGNVLGMFDTVNFETRRIPIQPGDRFFFYTDGLSECMRVDGPTGEKSRLTPLGIDRLISIHSGENLKTMTSSIWDGAMQFCRKRFDDDALLLAVEVPEKA